MRRDRARKVAGVAAAFLFALALAGCGRHVVAPTQTPPAASGDPGPGQTGKLTMDPVASELDQINQLINDIDNSVNSSDSGGDE